MLKFLAKAAAFVYEPFAGKGEIEELATKPALTFLDILESEPILKPADAESARWRKALLDSARAFVEQPSRIEGHALPYGDFTPNEREWRELKASQGLQRNYYRKVRRGEAPDLDDAAPKLVRDLEELSKAESESPGAWLTARGMDAYRDRLEIPDHELDTAGHRILDIGSGARQELASDARLYGMKSDIVSVDPRLGLSLSEDLKMLHSALGVRRSREAGMYLTPQEYRLMGRVMPQPGTLAADSENLPFADNTFHSVWGNYSLPYYSKNIGQDLSELNRVLAPDHTARLYPIRPRHVDEVQSWFSSHGITPTFKLKPENFTSRSLSDDDEHLFQLLTWTK